MRIEPHKKLFIAVKIDNKMREQLEKCPQRDRVYFESEDGRYLTVLRGGEDSFIGKLVDGATSAAAVEDLQRNVLSILNRLCPGRRDSDDVKVLATDEGEPPPLPPPKRRDEPPPSDYGRGGSGRGYY